MRKSTWILGCVTVGGGLITTTSTCAGESNQVPSQAREWVVNFGDRAPSEEVREAGGTGAINPKVWHVKPGMKENTQIFSFGYLKNPNPKTDAARQENPGPGRYAVVIRLKVADNAVKKPLLTLWVTDRPYTLYTHHIATANTYTDYRIPIYKLSPQQDCVSWKLSCAGEVETWLDRLVLAPETGEALAVTFGEPVVIPATDHWAKTVQGGHQPWCVNYFLAQDGSLMLNGNRSTDLGRTWTPVTNAPPTVGDGCIGRLRDGTLLFLGGAVNAVMPKMLAPGDFEALTWRSTDQGRSWQGPTPTPMTLPAEDPALPWCKDPEYYPGQGYLHHDIVELPDGTLLASAYGHYRNHDQPDTGGSTEQKFKNRTFVLRSEDRGASWQYLSTVGYDTTRGPDGFCEAALTRLASGDLLCMMRMGSRDPLYQAFSKDNGTTWSTPEMLPMTGVAPYLVVMQNGTLACSYGRPGCSIVFDPTGTGQHWGMPYTIAGAEKSVGYTCIREVAPGQLFYTHGTDDQTTVRGVLVRVERGNK